MNSTQKETIKEALKNYCAQQGSQNAAAKTLNNVSAATISQILQGNWDNIAATMWRRIAKQIGVNDEWIYAPGTHIGKQLNFFLDDAKGYANVHAIIHREGGSKTETAEYYAKNNENVWLIKSSEYFNRKTFLARILQVMGKDYSGTVSEMMESIVRNIEQVEEPLLIIDEADKLNDQVLSFFITFYNELEDKCGFIVMGTDFFKKRIDKGVRLNRRGYKELFSRFGRRFVELRITEKQAIEDMQTIINANGITDRLKVTEIINDSDGDLRRVKKLTVIQKRKAA